MSHKNNYFTKLTLVFVPIYWCWLLVFIPFVIVYDFSIRTYNINELLATKLRALYQRRKGRDLFDINYSRLHFGLDYTRIITCYKEYMRFSVGRVPSNKEFLLNIEEKNDDPNFIGDMEALLRTGIEYDQDGAFEWLKSDLIERMQKRRNEGSNHKFGVDRSNSNLPL